jgi:hypothetical protein
VLGYEIKREYPIEIGPQPAAIVIEDAALHAPEVGGYFVLPTFEYSGGSGKLTADCEVLFNGAAQTLNPYGRFSVDRPGMIRVILTVTDHIGFFETRAFTAAVTQEAPYLWAEGVPRALLAGTQADLSEIRFEAKTFAVAGDTVTETDLKTGIWVSADGVTFIELTGAALNAYAVPDVPTIRLRTVAADRPDDPDCYREFEIPVLSAADRGGMTDYFVYAPEAGGETRDDSVSFTLSNGVSIAYYDKIVADQAIVIASVAAHTLQAFTVTFEDYYDKRNAVVFSISYYDAGSSILRVCNDPDPYYIGGAFGGGNFKLLYDNHKKALLDDGGKTVCAIARNAAGNVFGGFESGLIRLSFSARDAAAPTTLEIRQLGNQTFGRYSYANGDKTGAQPLFSRPVQIKYTEEIGTRFAIPDCEAYDVLSGKGYVLLSAAAPDGSYIYRNRTPDAGLALDLTQYGYYRLDYDAYDRLGNRTTTTVRVYVADRTPPEISVPDTAVSASYRQGEELTLAAASVTDNHSPPVTSYIYIVRPDGKIEITAAGEVYRFARPGAYKIVYYARDNDFNVAEAVFKTVVY